MQVETMGSLDFYSASSNEPCTKKRQLYKHLSMTAVDPSKILNTEISKWVDSMENLQDGIIYLANHVRQTKGKPFFPWRKTHQFKD